MRLSSARARLTRIGGNGRLHDAPMARWIRFNLVGVLGFAVQSATLWLLVARGGLDPEPAVALAVLAALSHNFAWHERVTWPGPSAGRLVRWLSFHASTGLVSVVGNLVATALVMRATRLPAVPANLVAVGVLSLVNFWVSDRLVFRR
jgi:dolichol-phosphate mannosyltransferase